MNDLILTFLLMTDAMIVAVGLAKKKNMWSFIVIYWMILSTKLMMNLLAMM